MNSIESKIQPKAGVGALIIDSTMRHFITIVELDTNRSTNKLRGQLSVPMESVELRDRDHRVAWKKLFTQEIRPVNFNPSKVNQKLLGQFELVPGVLVHLRVFFVDPRKHCIELGSAANEVTDLRWRALDEVLTEPRGSLRLRPGLREVIETFSFDYLSNPNQFKPRLCGYDDLQDNIPQGVFDLIEGGLSVKQALFQLGIDGRYPQEYQILGRL